MGEKAFAHTGTDPHAHPDSLSQSIRVSAPDPIRYSNSLGHADRHTVAHRSSDTVANGPRDLEFVDPPDESSSAEQRSGGRTITAGRRSGRIRRVPGGICPGCIFFTRGTVPNPGRESLSGQSREPVASPGSDGRSRRTYGSGRCGFRGDVYRHRSRDPCHRRVRWLAFEGRGEASARLIPSQNNEIAVEAPQGAKKTCYSGGLSKSAAASEAIRPWRHLTDM